MLPHVDTAGGREKYVYDALEATLWREDGEKKHHHLVAQRGGKKGWYRSFWSFDEGENFVMA